MSILINSSDTVQFHNNGSLSFDGANDYATADGTRTVIDPDQGTVSAWVKLDSTSINGAVWKASVDTDNLLAISYNNSQQKIQMTFKGDGTAKVADGAFAVEGNDTWYNVILQWDTDPSANYVKGYVDGELLETTTELPEFTGSLANVNIGRNSVAANSYFSGHITHVSVFNTVVQPGLLYNGGSPGNLNGVTGLVAWYKMNEGSGTSVADSSPNSNAATLIHAPSWTTDTK